MYMSSQTWNNQVQCRAPMLIQRSHNAAGILSQCWSLVMDTNIETMFTQCWSITVGSDVATTLPERCLSVTPTVGHQCWDNVHIMWVTNIGERCCNNIHTTLPEHCLNIGPQCWGAMLPQCLNNVAWKLSQWWSPTLGSDDATMFTQHWLNIVSTLANIDQGCGNDGIMVEIQHWYNVRMTLSRRPHNVAGMFKGFYKWTCHNAGDRCWNNVSTNIVTTLPQHWTISWMVARDSSVDLTQFCSITLSN